MHQHTVGGTDSISMDDRNLDDRYVHGSRIYQEQIRHDVESMNRLIHRHLGCGTDVGAINLSRSHMRDAPSESLLLDFECDSPSANMSLRASWRRSCF